LLVHTPERLSQPKCRQRWNLPENQTVTALKVPAWGSCAWPLWRQVSRRGSTWVGIPRGAWERSNYPRTFGRASRYAFR